MSSNSEEFVSRSFPAQNIQMLNIRCKNYRVHFEVGESDEIEICYYNNRFRRLELQKGSHSLFLEEKMAVTFYEILRLMELMEHNELNIKIPANCANLNIIAETGVTEITADEIEAQNIRLTSASGAIRIRNICVGKSLCARSTSGKVSCILPGTEEDYDIDCRAERKDVAQPYYPVNRNAARKIVLRSSMYVPELMFTGEENRREFRAF